MRKSGNFYVNNDAEIKITCDANVAEDWYSTKWFQIFLVLGIKM